MDWIQVVFVLLFIILPLLQGLAERVRRPPADQEPSASLPEIATREPAVSPGPVASTGDDRSAWDAWFEPNAGEVRQVEAAQGEERLAEEIQPFEAISLEQFDEAPAAVVLERVTREAVPEPEPVVIDRAAEHHRFHNRYLAPGQSSARVETLPERLRKPGELRRAILLAEVLGPPRSAR